MTLVICLHYQLAKQLFISSKLYHRFCIIVTTIKLLNIFGPWAETFGIIDTTLITTSGNPWRLVCKPVCKSSSFSLKSASFGTTSSALRESRYILWAQLLYYQTLQVLQKASKMIKRFLTIRIFCDTFSDTADNSVVGRCNSGLNLCREVYYNLEYL